MYWVTLSSALRSPHARYFPVHGLGWPNIRCCIKIAMEVTTKVVSPKALLAGKKKDLYLRLQCNQKQSPSTLLSTMSRGSPSLNHSIDFHLFVDTVSQ